MRDDRLRSIRADNPGPFTLDGTRTYIVGRARVALIDPGPDMDDHVRAVVRSVADAEELTVLLSHGHGDHSDAVDAVLAARPDARLIGHGHPDALSPFDATGVEADRIGPSGAGGVHVATTDAGELFAVATPGHTRDHLCFHWPARRTLFAADMVLGVGDTTWVAEYPGCVADYLSSLVRLEALDLGRVLSAHGPDILDVPEVWSRYRAHRMERVARARAALDAEGLRPGEPRSPDELERLMRRVYGDDVPDGLHGAALASLRAVLDYVDTDPGPA